MLICITECNSYYIKEEREDNSDDSNEKEE